MPLSGDGHILLRMKYMLVASMLLVGAAGPQSDPWNAWEKGVARACPGRHVDWLSDAGNLNFIEAFSTSLAPADRTRLSKAADLEQRCAEEKMGFYCEMGGTIDAARRTGLLGRMIAFGCKTVKCEERSICSREPASSA